jgi:ACS family hexuronate transporter-like MFS transporter
MVDVTAPGTQAEQEPLLETRIGNIRWTICALLFAATTINYMDRQVIGLLKPTIQHSIGMTEVGYGYIVAAFQVAYAAGMLVMGRFVDKVGTRIGYMVVMGLWSLSAMGHALANTVMEFGVARFCLGLGESGNFPVAIKTVAEWFPQSERSLATGIFNSGTNVGAILAPIAVPWVALHYGWHAAFLITGAFSAIWILWWFFHYHKPNEHPRLAAAELRHINQDQEKIDPERPATTWIKLLGYRQTWGYLTSKFLTDPVWWFYLYWLPSYFTSRFHLTLANLWLPLFVVYNASTVGSIFGGWLPTPFRRFGMPVTRARLAAMLFCACMVVPIFLANFAPTEWTAIGLFSLAAASHQGWSANLFTTASDMFPRTEVGSVTGIGGMAGSAGGTLLAILAGYVLKYTHSYSILIGIAASAYLTALLCLVLLAPGLKKVEIAA